MLEIKNITFTVDDDGEEKKIIRDLSLKIDNGKFVVITGPNGSGKSIFAEQIVAQTEGRRFYIATMKPQTQDNFNELGYGWELMSETPYSVDGYNYYTYVYQSKLQPGNTTSALFEEVVFVDASEGALS